MLLFRISVQLSVEPLIAQPRFQHCLSIALAQAVSFLTLIGCHLNDESVRKSLKTQLRYEIINDLQF